MQQRALSQQENRRSGKNGFNGGKRSYGPRASSALMIKGAQDARRPMRRTRHWSGAPPAQDASATRRRAFDRDRLAGGHVVLEALHVVEVAAGDAHEAA